VFLRNGQWIANCPWVTLRESEIIEKKIVRYRTCGDMPITGAVLSEASTVEEIIREISATHTTERGTRADDRRSETAMEDRKKLGYF
jgi:sulfate adenylyltransferase subunit 2